MNNLKVGQKIYYTGDQANCDGMFVISAIRGNGYDLKEITTDCDGPRTLLGIHAVAIGDKYEGHCNQRFVTQEARKAYYAAADQKMAAMLLNS